MNAIEKSSLNHAMSELRYQQTPQALRDRITDRNQRIAADRKNGHSPKCTLTRCHPDCGKMS